MFCSITSSVSYKEYTDNLVIKKGLNTSNKDIFLIVCDTSLHRTLIINGKAPSTRQDSTLSGRLCILCREQKKVHACSEVVVANSICAGLFQLLLVDSQVPDMPEEKIITIISQQEQSSQECAAERCENTKKRKVVATEKHHSISQSNSHRSLDFDSNQKDVLRFTHN